MNFDWDDVILSENRVQQALLHLNGCYPDLVWYRISSSGTGLHVVIAELDSDLNLVPLSYSDDEQFEMRKLLSAPPYELECGGRLRADRERSAHGFRIGRIFSHKNEKISGGWNWWTPNTN